MSYRYRLYKNGREQENRRYTLHELRDMGTFLLRDICVREKIMTRSAGLDPRRLNREELIALLFRYRGREEDYLMDDLTVRHCMILMEPYAEWLPLWLYDHSGITMSCGSRTGQYADRWDSGGVGWIVVLKKTVMDEVGTEYVLDDEGELMRVEHKHPDAPSTWSYLTRPLTDETWRKRAIDIMKADVEVYDQYLTGDVYGFNLYSADPVEEGEEPEWNEEDSCWGFFGSDVMENGIEDHAGNGLREAVGSGCYEQGQAVEHSRSWLTF